MQESNTQEKVIACCRFFYIKKKKKKGSNFPVNSYNDGFGPSALLMRKNFLSFSSRTSQDDIKADVVSIKGTSAFSKIKAAQDRSCDIIIRNIVPPGRSGNRQGNSLASPDSPRIFVYSGPFDSFILLFGIIL